MTCWIKRLALCLPIMMSTCVMGVGATAASLNRQPIARVWVTPKPLGAVKSCLIKALDDARRTYSRISPSVKHRAKIIKRNSIIDVRPIDEDALVDVDYHVRLEKIHDVITRVALYTAYSGVNRDRSGPLDEEPPRISTGRDVARAISRCSPPPGN
jgi:hypothetical protein